MSPKSLVELKINVDTDCLKPLKRQQLIKMYVENTHQMISVAARVQKLEEENEFYRKIIERLI